MQIVEVTTFVAENECTNCGAVVAVVTDGSVPAVVFAMTGLLEILIVIVLIFVWVIVARELLSNKDATAGQTATVSPGIPLELQEVKSLDMQPASLEGRTYQAMDIVQAAAQNCGYDWHSRGAD